MDARKKKILKAVVDKYIQGAEPVGSKSLSGKEGLDVSSATLRNEMAALEEMGYLISPHTSAGRIPTAAGYRLYVNELMQTSRISDPERDLISRVVQTKVSELDRLIQKAGRLVADLTHYAAVATAVREKKAAVSRLELFLSDPFSLVMVAVLEGGFVENRLCRLPYPAAEADVEALRSALSGNPDPLSLAESEIHARAGTGFLYWPYVREFLHSLTAAEEEIYVAGEANLLSHPEYHDVLRARRTLEYITGQREEMLRQIPKGNADEKIQITIGPENVAAELADASVVMATYHLQGGLRGMIGIVGPTRMDYSHLTSRLSYFASRLGSMTQNGEDEGRPPPGKAGRKKKEDSHNSHKTGGT